MIYKKPNSPGSVVSFKPRYENFIGGEWVAPVGGEYFDNPSPVDNQVFTKVPRSRKEDIELALDAAHKAREKWGRTSVTERSNLLLKIADRLEQNLEKLAVAETWENGKAVRETLAADADALATALPEEPVPGARTTRGRVWELLHSESFDTREDAMSREWHLKRDRKFRKEVLTAFAAVPLASARGELDASVREVLLLWLALIVAGFTVSVAFTSLLVFAARWSMPGADRPPVVDERVSARALFAPTHRRATFVLLSILLLHMMYIRLLLLLYMLNMMHRIGNRRKERRRGVRTSRRRTRRTVGSGAARPA